MSRPEAARPRGPRARAGAARRIAAFAALSLVLALPFAARAEDRVLVHVLVHQVSRQPGPIDSDASDLDPRLREEFGFRSAKLLGRHDLRLATGETASVDLPSGRAMRVKLRKREPDAVRLSVEIEGRLRTSLRARSGHRVVIGAESGRNGTVVVTLTPE